VKPPVYWTRHRQVYGSRSLATSERPSSRLDAAHFWKTLLLLLLTGLLIFAHGCHGDEDNELFAARRSVAWLND
jgi:hypothetical protein